MSSDLITVARFTAPSDAFVLRARLESEGIFAFIADQHLLTANSFYAVEGGVRVQVYSIDLAPAREVIAALERGDYALGDDDLLA
jgi:hypothetical protein